METRLLRGAWRLQLILYDHSLNVWADHRTVIVDSNPTSNETFSVKFKIMQESPQLNHDCTGIRDADVRPAIWDHCGGEPW